MWLLENSALQALQQNRDNVSFTAEQQEKFLARFDNSDTAGTHSRILTITDSVAEISIQGALTQAPDFLAMLFGGGNITYPEIIQAIHIAEKNTNVETITLKIDSPGGHINGLFPLLDIINASEKPIKTLITGICASAAYAIASQTDEIIAQDISVRIGSIGIAQTFALDPLKVAVTSSKAPKKHPDVTTALGKKVVTEQLDEMHLLFITAIAKGRGITPEKVNADFGQGAMFLADSAKNQGMIDTIEKSISNNNNNTTIATPNQNQEANMNLIQLQTEHPEIYAQAVSRGSASERDRVTAHLTMGTASGDFETAIAAINDGSEMTQSLQATYLAASMNRKDIQNRQEDDTTANAGDDPKPKEESATVVDLIEAQLDITRSS